MEMTQDFKACQFVYAGQHSEGSYIYFNLPEYASNDGRSAVGYPRIAFTKALFKNKCIGGVYDIEYNGQTARRSPAERPKEIWKNGDDLAAWRLKDRTTELLVLTLKKGQQNHTAKLLQPLRVAYREASANARPIMLAEIVRIITG